MSANRILVVDDDRHLQRVLQVCLEEAGYVVEQATDGAQALEAIGRGAPDVVLLDLAMPVLDGMSVLADLRALLEAHRPVHVVVMTATGSARTALCAMRLGAEDFLEKPFRPTDVRRAVGRVLGVSPCGGDSGICRDVALESTREALRRGKFFAAEAALARAGGAAESDAGVLNLAGVLQEAHGRNVQARRFYERALAAAPDYAPARFNLKRLSAVERQGFSRFEPALGDEPVPAVADVGDAG